MKSQIFDQDTGQAGPDTQGVPDEWSATVKQVHLEMYDKSTPELHPVIGASAVDFV